MKGWESVCDAVKIDRLARIPKLGALTIIQSMILPLPKVTASTELLTAVWQKTGSLKQALSFIEKQAGLTSTEDVVLFDGTGVVCQDLAVASDAVELALKTGDAVEIVS